MKSLGNMSDLNGRAWRFLALGDPTVDLMLSRDLDSALSVRERVAVKEWEMSNYSIHVLRDHYDHNIKILGKIIILIYIAITTSSINY